VADWFGSRGQETRESARYNGVKGSDCRGDGFGDGRIAENGDDMIKPMLNDEESLLFSLTGQSIRVIIAADVEVGATVAMSFYYGSELDMLVVSKRGYYRPGFWDYEMREVKAATATATTVPVIP